MILYTLGTISCKEDTQLEPAEPGKLQTTKTYLGFYLEADSISTTLSPFKPSEDKIGVIESVGLNFHGKLITFNKHKERFDYYSKLYGDTAYNRPNDLMSGPKSIVANRSESINVTCCKFYDDNHPAGSSLNDIIRMKYRSPYHYIKNGYELKGQTYNELFQHEKLLSEMTAEDFYLMEYVGLKFVSQPSRTTSLIFTLTWKTADQTIVTKFTNVQ